MRRQVRHGVTDRSIVSAPTVTGVVPSRGPLASDVPVTISGTRLNTVTGVKFGTLDATFEDEVSRTSTHVVVFAPTATTPGEVAVVLTFASGRTLTASTKYMYMPGKSCVCVSARVARMS
jgi:hypothetical protein